MPDTYHGWLRAPGDTWQRVCSAPDEGACPQRESS